MQLGMIGLGRMGANIVRRLMRDGHDCVVFDVSADAVAALAAGGRHRRDDAARSSSPSWTSRACAWVMIPAGITDKVVDELAELMEPGDIIIDGGNSNYRDDIDRAARAQASAASTTSTSAPAAACSGLERGYCLMIGGERRRRRAPRPAVRDASRRASGSIERTPGRTGDADARGAGLPALRAERRRPLREDGPQRHRVRDHGRLRRGPERPAPRRTPARNSRSTPPRSRRWTTPEYYQYDLDIAKVTEVWRRGGGRRVVAARPDRGSAASSNPDLEGLAGRVSDSGEGRWTVKAAIDEGVPVPVLSRRAVRALQLSRGEADYADKLLSAMRKAVRRARGAGQRRVSHAGCSGLPSRGPLPRACGTLPSLSTRR